MQDLLCIELNAVLKKLNKLSAKKKEKDAMIDNMEITNNLDLLEDLDDKDYAVCLLCQVVFLIYFCLVKMFISLLFVTDNGVMAKDDVPRAQDVA